jgi:general secretion pathway protein E
MRCSDGLRGAMRCSETNSLHLLRIDAPPTDPRDPPTARRFLEFLRERGLLDPAAVERAAKVQLETRQRIDVVIAELGLVPAPEYMAAISDYFGYPILGETDLPALPALGNLENLLSPDFMRRNGLLPIELAADALVIATIDPFNTETLTAVAYLVDKPVAPCLVSQQDFSAALQRLYEPAEEPSESSAPGEQAGEEIFVSADDVQRLKDVASEAPVIQLVNRLMRAAVQQRASDIHIEPAIDGLRVRYRIDGVMAEVERLPPEMQAGVASRIKILAKLNIAERRMPQDGRIKIAVAGREIDLRISTSPVMHGESIVMRILDQEQVDLSFAALGFDDRTTTILNGLLALPNGIILVSGPTGSGKTTTLYSALKLLNSVERKVFSIEDPIEYQLPGVNQMQIKPAIGLDFVHCLRAILRQDPDVIMVGEMRDVETASTAIRASLTGHLVLSTVHTNSAAASITRLLDMGVEDYLLASSLSAVLAQRLVRRLCPDCATPAPANSALMDRLQSAFSGHATPPLAPRVHIPVGCPVCRHTGFRGRTSIAEILVVDDVVRARIKAGTTDREIEAAGLANGMETLYQNGLRKVFGGETSLEEVLRVARS